MTHKLNIDIYLCSCGSKILYNPTYDSYVCVDTNEWLESQCSDDKCFYCSCRPDKFNPDSMKKEEIKYE